jgi:putative metalloprotease
MTDFAAQNTDAHGDCDGAGRFLPGIGGWIGNGLMALLAAAVACLWLRRTPMPLPAVKCGIGTAPQQSLFLARALTGTAGKGTPAWMLSHPKTARSAHVLLSNRTRRAGT